MKNNLLILSISLILVCSFAGISAANSSERAITTYYASIEPDLEGHAYFQINVQDFNNDNSRIFGIGTFNPTVGNYTYSGVEKSYEYVISIPNTSINILYNNGKIENIYYYSGEFEFLGNFYFDLPVPSQLFYVKTTDEIKNNNVSNFKIEFYDSNFNSEKNYGKYPFDDYKFTYDITFLNESFVILTVSPINPNNFYKIDVSLNHIYKSKNGTHFEEKMDSIYDGVYRINFKTKNNESLDEINIIYNRKIGLAQISFYVLIILMISMICVFRINLSNKIQKELNAVVFGTLLSIYTFSSSIGYAYKPSWLETVSYFDIIFIINSILLMVYFVLLIKKWNG